MKDDAIERLAQLLFDKIMEKQEQADIEYADQIQQLYNNGYVVEKSKRKVYAGGIGYFSANGEFDTCIALRTAVAKNKKFYVQAGAGIVADSKPIKEYEETVNKAKALINALR